MKTIKLLFFLIILTGVNSCVEPIEINNITYENFLVVEGNLTNELKNHTIKLSRTFSIEETQTNPETNASVLVKDNNGSTFIYSETTPGVYTSTLLFKAEVEKLYTLEITTKNGNTYHSTPQKIVGFSEIESVESKKITKPNGDEGIGIFVKSNNSTDGANYYRYTYEETYKIIAPEWSPLKLEIVSNTPRYKVKTVLKNNTDGQVCYKTINGTNIVQTETFSLSENKVDLNVRFLDKNDFIISHRYSMLLTQHVASFEAYSYYKTLDKISTSQGTFTQNQPGLLSGNIISDTNINDKVLGYFDVTTVSKKRMFFNYADYFPNNVVDYIEECVFINPLLEDPNDPFEGTSPLIDEINRGNYLYNQIYEPPPLTIRPFGPYLLVAKVCGDCRVLGDGNKPPFWVD
ncbi:DUF4249 domain-containing protein [Polaribacter sp.]|uniref:DUF4249 domain-containing protein n=1 Tax=Polaribacter sp. TaxID=1920175 RepID=UPI003EF6F579